MKRVRNHPAAGRELSEAEEWYEKAQAGLGYEFLLEVDHTLAEIARGTVPTLAHPEISEVRRAPLRRFPYWLVLLERPGELVLLAVAHMRRSPGYWNNRLSHER